jgi:hypothetical protein
MARARVVDGARWRPPVGARTFACAPREGARHFRHQARCIKQLAEVRRHAERV